MITNKKNILSKDIYASDVYQHFSKTLKLNMLDFFDDVKEISLSSNQANELLSVDIHNLNILSSYLRTIKNIFIQFEQGQYNYFEEKVIKVTTNNQMINNVDKDEINEKQMQNSLIHKYEKKNISTLFQFKQQLSLLYKQPIDSNKLTLSPFVVVSTFAKSIRLLQLSYNNKIILYKSFEKCVLSQLNKTYEDIYKQYFKQEAKKQDLNITAYNSNEKNYTREQINHALSIVQNNLSLKEPLQIQNAFLTQLKTSQQLLTLTQVDKDNLNLITLIFQQIQNNKLIELEIKKILSNLQLTYIKYAFFDESLLHNHQHPAKLLLNEIVQTSQRWEKHKDVSAQYIKQLKSFINTIVNYKSLDNHFFTTKIQSFKELATDCQGFVAPNLPTNNSDEGRNKIITAMKTIDALLNHKTEEHETPEYIEKILRASWKNLLVLLLVRHSNSSNKYLEMINFIDDLFALLTHKSPTSLDKSISDVCTTFEKGLKLIAYQESDIIEQSKDLKKFIINYHKKLANKKSKSFANGIVTKIHSNISLFNKSSKPKNENKTVSINKFLINLSNADKQLVRPISYGTWLEFKHSNGKTIKAQLSWINPKTGRYLFVNNKGLKITDKSVQQLADGIRENEILIK